MSANPTVQAVEKFNAENQKNLDDSHNTEKVPEKRYYARINGTTHIFKDGTIARFTNGVYVTNRKWEQDQLDHLLTLSGNSLITDHEVPVHNDPTVIISKEVGRSEHNGGAVHSGTGMVSSATLAALAQRSGR